MWVIESPQPLFGLDDQHGRVAGQHSKGGAAVSNSIDPVVVRCLPEYKIGCLDGAVYLDILIACPLGPRWRIEHDQPAVRIADLHFGLSDVKSQLLIRHRIVVGIVRVSPQVPDADLQSDSDEWSRYDDIHDFPRGGIQARVDQSGQVSRCRWCQSEMAIDARGSFVNWQRSTVG